VVAFAPLKACLLELNEGVHVWRHVDEVSRRVC
jgi:hypothetical protein